MSTFSVLCRHAVWCAGVVVMCSACAVPPSQATAAEPAPASATPLTVTDLIKNAASLHGRTVTVIGRFAGWTGHCTGGASRTRSDWMLVDTSQCIYVSGAVPEGVTAPPDTLSNGQLVTLRARLEMADDGRPYLSMK